MTSEDLSFEYPSKENPDWNFVRNRSFILKNEEGHFSSSLSSSKIGDFTSLNRDYQEQGLVMRLKDKYWKFLDSFLFKLKIGDKNLQLEPTRVKVSPWKSIFYYKSDECILRVGYELLKSERKKIPLHLSFSLEPKTIKDFTLILSPLVDIRRLDQRSFGNYEVDRRADRIKITRKNKSILISPVGKVKTKKKRIREKYKLGSIFNTNGSKKRKPTKIDEFTFNLEDNLKFSCVAGENLGKEDLYYLEDLKINNKLLDKISFPVDHPKKEKFSNARVFGFSNLNLRNSNLKLPSSLEGVSFGELFQSLNFNLNTYKELHGDEFIENLFSYSSLFIENGKMYKDLDRSEKNLKTLLFYLLSLTKWLKKTEEKRLEGVLHKEISGLLKQMNDEGFLFSKRGSKKVLHPDINALWINLLREYEELSGKVHSLKIAEENFKKIFWNQEEGFLYNFVKGTKKDETRHSRAIKAVSLVPDLFKIEDLEKIYHTLNNKLLVRRKPLFFERKMMPFGLLSNENESILDLKNSLYLSKFYSYLGKKNKTEQILTNILDHQMYEGFLFYTNRFFKVPQGKNPSPFGISENPLPFKSPISLVSQFIEPFKK